MAIINPYAQNDPQSGQQSKQLVNPYAQGTPQQQGPQMGSQGGTEERAEKTGTLDKLKASLGSQDPQRVEQAMAQANDPAYLDSLGGIERMRLGAAVQQAKLRETGDITTAKEGLENIERSPIGQFGTGAVQGVRETGQGIEQLGVQAGEALGIAEEGATQRYTQSAQRQRQSAREDITSPALYGAGKIAGEFGPYVAIPGGAAGGVLARMGTGALTGAGIGGSQFVKEGGSRTANTLLGGILGGSLPAIQAGFKGAAGMFTKGGAKRKLAKEVERHIPKDIERNLKAAKQTDTFMTPGEASGSEALKGLESQLHVSRGSQSTLGKALRVRERGLQGKVGKLIDDVVPEGDKAAAEAAERLYSKAGAKRVSGQEFKELMDDPILRKNYELAKKDVDWKLGSYEDKSVAQLNEFKKFMDSKISKGKMSGDTNRNITAAKDKLIETLDKTSPDYSKARKVASRIIMKRGLKEELSKITLAPGKDKATASQVYSKLLGSETKRKDFYGVIERAGGDVEQAKNLTTVLNAIEKTDMAKLVKKMPQQGSAFEAARTPAKQAITRSYRALRGKHTDELIDLAVNPAWRSELKAIAALKGKPQFYERLTKLLSRTAEVKATRDSSP